ncbi:MAG: response regulator [Bryobacteraceae bacterium]|jgi:two-component system, cell cycle sensor histidine kinase and response regulator CckA
MPSFERCVVLVADDEPVVLRLVTGLLTRHGYIVIPATDGRSALDACLQREGPIHLALLDVMMPGMTGPELAECLKEHHPKIDVLFMSGFRTDEIADIAPSIQKAHFIAKPFLPRDLVMRVNSILGNTEVCVLLEDEAQATRA